MNAPSRSLPRAPGPRPDSWLLGHLGQLQQDALGLLSDNFVEYGDVVRYRFGPVTGFLIARPEHIRHFLQLHHHDFDKKVVSYLRMKSLLGNGLLTSEGPFWQRQRRIAQPAFRHGQIVALAPWMVRAAEHTADRWSSLAEGGEIVDLHREMMTLTLRIAAETLVGSGVDSGEAMAVGEAMNAVFDDFQERLYAVVPVPEWIPTAANRRLRRAKQTLDDMVLRIIAERRASRTGDRQDLLSRLIEARDDETGEAMTDRQLRDEVMTILLAGHETTANALTFTWYLLARHRDAAARLRSELDSELAGRAPTADDLATLPYTKRVIEEAMRLYPPAWVFERRARSDDEIGGFHIPKGSVLMASPWVTHRHPEIWKDPERFDPERFDPEGFDAETVRRQRSAYLPFGLGPRACIGGAFAMLEARLVLATLAQRFEVELVDDAPPALDPNVTLRPRDGLPVRLRRVGRTDEESAAEHRQPMAPAAADVEGCPFYATALGTEGESRKTA